MKKEFLEVLSCPNCQSGKMGLIITKEIDDEIITGDITCPKCKNAYPILDSIPIFLNYTNNEESIENLKQHQIEYYNEKCDEDFEINRPHNTGRLYKYFIDYKFEKVFSNLPFGIKNSTLLDACCGSGMASEYYAKNGANVVGIDISFEAVKRAKKRSIKYGFNTEFLVADVETLPFKNNSFDFVCVHDGLHHLENPEKGVSELVRITDKVFFTIEPARAFLTKISVLLGISTNREEAGNYVYRFTKKQLKKWSEKLGFNSCISKRYLMYYPHFPPNWFGLFESKIMFNIFLVMFHIINATIGFLGNKILFITWNKTRKAENLKCKYF